MDRGRQLADKDRCKQHDPVLKLYRTVQNV